MEHADSLAMLSNCIASERPGSRCSGLAYQDSWTACSERENCRARPRL